MESTVSVKPILARNSHDANHVLAWVFVVLLLDGYDVGAIAYAAPALLAAWGLDRAALGPLFSASLIGVLVGAPLFGYLGDRYGRKPQIVIGCLIFGGFTLAMAWASNLNQGMLLRLLAGVGLGAVPPNVFALLSEFAPAQKRRAKVVLASAGVTLGAALPGGVAVWLVPRFGWPIIFVIGGVLPLLIGALVVRFLPESPRFLAKQNEASAGGHGERVRLRHIFSGGLGVPTLLLWGMFILHALSFVFLFSWLPVLMGAAGIPAQSAFALSTLLPIGGALSGIVISAFRLLERGGLAFVAALFLISGPVIASFGYAGKDQMLLAVAVFTAGFCFNAVQFCLNATATMLYPEDVRSLGVGWASGLARLGSIAGPAIGGYLLGVIRLPLTDLYLCAAAPMVLGLALAWALKLTAPLAVQRENQ